MSSIQKHGNGKYRARFRDPTGKEYAKHFERKIDAQRWLDQQTAATLAGTWTDPKTAKTTLSSWCDTWLAGYTRRPSTVRQAKVHIARIKKEFGTMPLSTVRPSQVRSFMAKLKQEGLADSFIYAIHARLAHIMADAVHEGSSPGHPAPGVPHRQWVDSGPTCARLSKCGRCTMRCRSG
ncbi:MAG TPA: hypothetical protein VEJ42_06565 [Streptosporangiaceae bacterium]|nr:hypothetical protein [Streptosporangiaceae bacterium]